MTRKERIPDQNDRREVDKRLKEAQKEREKQQAERDRVQKQLARDEQRRKDDAAEREKTAKRENKNRGSVRWKGSKKWI